MYICMYIYIFIDLYKTFTNAFQNPSLLVAVKLSNSYHPALETSCNIARIPASA